MPPGPLGTPLRLDQFAHEYVRDFNAVRAYLRTHSGNDKAEYESPEYKNAGRQACALMKRPEVRALIYAAARTRREKMEITDERILQEEARIAFFDPRDLFDAEGRPIPLHLLPTHVATALSIEISNGRVTTKPHEKQKAVEVLAKYRKLLGDAPPPPQWTLDPATLAKMSTEDLETALKHADRVQELLAGKKPDEGATALRTCTTC